MSVSLKMFRGSARILLAESLALPCSLVLVPVLARLLGPAGFGLYVLAVAVVSWLEWTLNTLFGRASIKLVGEDHEGQKIAGTVLQLYTLTAILFSTLLFLLAGAISDKLGEPGLVSLLRWFAIDIPLWSAGQAYRVILVAREAFRERAWLTATRWISRTIFTLVCVLLSPTVESAIAGWVLSSVAELILGMHFVSVSLWNTVSRKTFLRLLGYAAPLSLLGLILRFFDKLDIFVLKWMGATAEAAGVYGAAQNVSRAMGLLSLSIAPPLLATVTRLIAKNQNAEASRLISTSYRGMLLLIPVMVFGVALSPELIPLIFGKEYVPAVSLMQPLIYSAFCLMMISVSNAILTATGHPKLALYLTFPILPVAITGYLLMIPAYGGSGAAYVSFFSAALIGLISTVAVHIYHQFSFPFLTLARSIVISLLIWISLGLWHPQGWLIAVKVLSGLLAIPAMLWISGELRQKDLSSIRAIVVAPTGWPARMPATHNAGKDAGVP